MNMCDQREPYPRERVSTKWNDIREGCAEDYRESGRKCKGKYRDFLETKNKHILGINLLKK